MSRFSKAPGVEEWSRLNFPHTQWIGFIIVDSECSISEWFSGGLESDLD